MRVDDYLSVCMFQLKVNLDCNSVDEYIIETKEVNSQLEAAFSIFGRSDKYSSNPKNIIVEKL